MLLVKAMDTGKKSCSIFFYFLNYIWEKSQGLKNSLTSSILENNRLLMIDDKRIADCFNGIFSPYYWANQLYQNHKYPPVSFTVFLETVHSVSISREGMTANEGEA